MKAFGSVDIIGFKEKPRNAIVQIKRRTCEHWGLYDIKELANLVGNKGHSLVPAKLADGIAENNFEGMQLFALDFDNGISFEEIKALCDEKEIPISFAYRTLSSSERAEKFRVVFVYECLIKDKFVAKVIMAMLHRIFPQCDQQCKNLDRLFYGGKELIYFDDSARIALVHLIIPFMNTMEIGDNYKRNVKNFCNINNVGYNGEIPLIFPTKQTKNFDGFMDSTNNIYNIGESTFPSFSIVEGYKKHLGNECKRKQTKVNLDCNLECKLLEDFFAGEEVGHHAKFAIITNLIHINGGEKRFFKTLEEYDYESYIKWKRAIRYIKGYKCARCKNTFCSYFDDCNDSGTIFDTLKRDRKVYVENSPFYSLEEARKNMVENLEKAFANTGWGLHLIKAQTALGKTTAYKDLVYCNYGARFVIALPTNKLRDEVVRDLIYDLGEENVYSTPTVTDNPLIPSDIATKIQKCHDRGIHNQTGRIIREFLKEIELDPSKYTVVEECNKILAGTKNVTQRVIVTTHAYLKQIDYDVLKNRTIIIDEDILQLDLLNTIREVSEFTLSKIAKSNYREHAEKAREMLNAPIDKVILTEPSETSIHVAEQIIDRVDCYDNDNIGDIVDAVSYIKLIDDKSKQVVVRYFCAPKLINLKYIVMSATLNVDIYRRYFKGIHIYADDYPEKRAKYEGELIQYTYHSLGRRSLEKKMSEVFNFACNVANDENLPFITFKNFKTKEELEEYNFLDLHFGNTSGIDKYKGKNVGIVGTYYNRNEVYKLIAAYLGADVNTKDDMNPRPRRVSYDNKNFLITTYKDPLLQQVQLYQIHSEMEQAVGRARLLRHNCKVYLFSAFPCDQANIHTQNYL